MVHPISQHTLHKQLSSVGVIDFRERSAFTLCHFRHSLHIPGVQGLYSRFSWLPPPKSDSNPGLALLIICCREDEEDLRSLLSRWNVVKVVIQDDEEFWERAREQGNLVIEGQDDESAILFQPSPVTELALRACESANEGVSSTLTVLDLGCGAARDIAWITRRKSKLTWLATGLDNLYATIQRATLLRHDMRLNKEGTSRIERLIWAQASEQGTLQALQLGPGSKSKRKPIASSDGDHSLKAFAALHLPHQTYDLILLVRFLPRSLIKNLPQLSHDKTIIAISHFTSLKGEQDYPSPDSSKRFEVEDVLSLLDRWGTDQWKILDQIIHRAEDGRPVRSVLFQRNLTCTPTDRHISTL